MHIGKHIKVVIKAKDTSVTSLAKAVGTTRTNMHKILRKESIDVSLLMKISRELKYDFFKDISEEVFSVSENSDWKFLHIYAKMLSKKLLSY